MKPYLLICLLLLSANAHGALHKWVDVDGKVQYSDEPPPGNVKAQTLTAPSAASDVPAQKSVLEREAERKKTKQSREEAEQKAAKQQEEVQAKQKNCNGLRANLATLENSPNISSYNAQGGMAIMDNATRQQEIAETRKQIGANCGN